MTDLIARLEELEKAAAPGPWFVHANDLIGGWSVMNCDLPPSRADPKEGNYEVGAFMSGTSDSALIVELRNNLPAIIHALKVQQAAEDLTGLLTERPNLLCPVCGMRLALSLKAAEQVVATIEALQAEVTTLRTALERIAQSAKALRYASIEDKALEALHGRE